MKLDLRKFKKVREDQHSATLEHPEGHQIRIAKNVLSPKMRGDLSELPMHLDEGGDVPDQKEDQPQPQQPTIVINAGGNQQPNPITQMPAYDPNAANYQLLSNPGIGNSAKEAVAQKAGLPMNADQINQTFPQGAAHEVPAIAPAAQQINPAVQTQETSQTQPANDPFGSEAYQNAYMQGLGERKAGLGIEAQTAEKEGQMQAGAWNASIKNQQTSLQNYEANEQDLVNEHNNLVSDYQNGHLDPQHYLHSMGTGQRIATAIGLMMGGFAGGATHQQNPAMAFLNDQIQRDVNAQASEMGKKENLLSANMKQFGNLHDAAMMTNAMQMGIVSSKLKLEAASAASPLAKARALQAAGELDQQSAGILSQLAMKRTLASGAQNGQMDPSMFIRAAVPEHQQAAAYKELGQAQELSKARDNVLSVFDQIQKINTLANRTANPIQTKRKVDALRNNAAVMMAKDEAGRVNEFEFDAAKDAFKNVGDDAGTEQVKRNFIDQSFKKKMNAPILNSYGINPFQGGKYNQSGQKSIQLGAPVPVGGK